MIWLNPWAWVGLLALAVPVLVHLLARHSARVQRFPTLRFLPAMQLVATRRSRLSDPLLLALRVVILLVAVAALAQPFLLTRDRTAAPSRVLVRAVIVDTSASMLRATPAGEPALAAARRNASLLAGEAAVATVIETAAAANAVAGAAAWLAVQPGLHEIVVLSDFQRGTLDAADLAAVPAETGITLRRVEVVPATWPAEDVVRHRESETVARVSLAGPQTAVEWSRRPSGPAAGADPLLLSGAEERTAAQAALRAALAATALPPPDRPLAVTYPGHAGLDSLLGAAVPFGRPWMVSVAAALRQDAALQATALRAAVDTAAALPGAPFVVVARNAAHEPVALAAQAELAGVDRLLLLVRAPPGTLVSAAVIAAAARAASPALPVGELEPEATPAAELAAWERPAERRAAAAADGTGAESDGRWLWLLVLGLLGLETWLRRQRRKPAEAAHEPVA